MKNKRFQKKHEKEMEPNIWRILEPVSIFGSPKTPPFRATAIAGYLQITYLKQIKKEKGDV